MRPRRRATRTMSKRLILALGLVAAVVAVVLIASGGDGSSDGYRVRAVFDNGGFMVKGEERRVAGATVRETERVRVSRTDATCQIRPQSLMGEKSVDCRPPLPRAPGTEPLPALKQVPDGEPGE